MVVTGKTYIPRWACVFNTLPVFLILAPTKIPAKGNIANAFMFLGYPLKKWLGISEPFLFTYPFF